MPAASSRWWNVDAGMPVHAPVSPGAVDRASNFVKPLSLHSAVWVHAGSAERDRLGGKILCIAADGKGCGVPARRPGREVERHRGMLQALDGHRLGSLVGEH